MSPGRSPDDRYTELYENLYNSSYKNQLDIALLQKDLQQIRDQVVDIRDDVKSIKNYFVKALIGIGSVVGVYFLQWILGGGLASVISTIQPN